MQSKTAICDISDNKETIRGYDLAELIKNKSFVETIFLVLKGNLPNDKETRMLNALFTAAIDHGVGTASTVASRTAASAGNSMQVALAAGILAMNKMHGAATEDAAKFFSENIQEKNVADLVRSLKEQKIRLPGFGHRILTHDHRSDALFIVSKEIGFYGQHCAFAEEVGVELNKSRTSQEGVGSGEVRDKISSKPLPLNVDGAMAAILLDMGFPWQMATGFFIIARVPGLVAHIYEEMMSKE